MTDTDVNNIVTRTRTRAPTLLIIIIALRKRKKIDYLERRELVIT